MSVGMFDTACPPDDPMAPIEVGFLRRSGSHGIAELARRIADEPRGRHISIHAPTDVLYGDDESTREIVGFLNAFHPRVTHAVFHPDTLRTFSVFRELRLIPCLENSDQRTDIGTSALDMLNLMREAWKVRSDVGLVLDLAHCHLNDPTMGLAYRFLGNGGLSAAISEIHISGTKDGYRAPIFETEQLVILEALKWIPPHIPVIIESPIRDYVSAVEEYRYISSGSWNC